MDTDVRGSDGVELPMDNNRAGVVVAVVATLLPLTGLVVAMRFYARQRLDNWVGLDDWAVLIATVFIVAKGITVCLMTQVGLGQHIWNLSELQLEEYYKRFYFAIILYYCGLGSIKIALLLQYRRIFNSKLRRVINTALLIIGSWSIGLVMLSIFTCYPIQGYWDKDIKATCIPTFQWYIHSAGNILSDIVVFTLPIPVLWSMRVSIGQRLLLILVFSLGLFNCVISGLRVMYLPIVNINPDVTYENLDATAWSVAEVCLAIICACLPTLRPLYARAARERFADCLRSSCKRRKRQSYGGPPRDLRTPEEAVPDPFGCSMSRENNDVEKLSPRVSMKFSIDTGSDMTRTYQSRGPSQCGHYCDCHRYELVESPQFERKPVRAPAKVPLSSPFQPPDRRRPSVQSILDEIVVTQPPSAILHEALGSNFPIRAKG
ncbi:putative integral membrane protein [Diaporthe ampelina]|uniref:Putative integral membrane protein n=1 Tax=Diaporthe ampelina TaxID=1214573 RepID=A0A0G2HLK2_9PEZI|nr:putative integral membrane protein [Diaporthe ampelina]